MQLSTCTDALVIRDWNSPNFCFPYTKRFNVKRVTDWKQIDVFGCRLLPIQKDTMQQGNYRRDRLCSLLNLRKSDFVKDNKDSHFGLHGSNRRVVMSDFQSLDLEKVRNTVSYDWKRITNFE